jgi:hypothetical protein
MHIMDTAMSKVHYSGRNLLTWVASLFISLPVSIILFNFTRHLPIDNYIGFIPVDPLKIKFFLTLFACFFLLEYIIVQLRILLYGICIFVFGFLGVNQFRNNGYNFENAYNDYEAILFSLNKKNNSILPDLPPGKKFSVTGQIKEAVNYSDPIVRNFAVASSVKYFTEDDLYQQYGDVVRYCSVFKSIKEKWKYVHDPANEEYFAKASESLQHFSGDCDDYSALMCASIKAVGGQARLVIVDGHIYPEVNIGSKNNFDRITFMITRVLFKKEYNGNSINGHTDEDGNVWLNFDYSANYPGGPFMENNKVVKIIEL